MTQDHFPSDREIVLVRTFNAPRERVFGAFVGPGIEAWWGPEGFTLTTSSRDVRPGGQWRYTMSHPQWGTFPDCLTYREITPPERLVYRIDGDVNDPVGGFEATVTFRDLGGRTEVTMHTLFPTAETCATAKQYNAVGGGSEMFAKLAAIVEA